MTQEVLKLALEALEYHTAQTRPIHQTNEAITAIKEALAQEKALQALHDENERLGLYKDAYAEPEEEKLHPVHIGVDVTREGTAVTAFYRKPDAVMEMFYSQFHPAPQRTWVGLTDEEVESYWDWEDFQTGAGCLTILKMVRDIEAKLKQKNGYAEEKNT